MENTQIQPVDQTTEIVDTKGANSKLASMMAFVKQTLKKGNDYMSIGGGKPTLLKSGAEKMNILMGYSAEYEKQDSVMNANDQYYYVEIKCILRNKQGQKVAEGIGSCNNKERAKQNVAFYDSLNTVLKMAEKRAYVAATLNANALSQFYTQDLEDNQETEEIKLDYKCEECKEVIEEKVASFSANRYGKMLCRIHQQGKNPLK